MIAVLPSLLISVLVNVKSNDTLITGKETTKKLRMVDYGTLWKYTTTRNDILETAGPLQAEYEIMVSQSVS